MNLKRNRLKIIFVFVALINGNIYGQKEITAVFPADGASNVNIGILKWDANKGMKYDLYIGNSTNPSLYKPDLDSMEIKPIMFELNKKYYWKIVEKKEGKVIKTSKIFSFSTLPIILNATLTYKPFVDLRDYKIYWTIIVNENEWFVQNLDYDLPNNSWYYENNENNKVYGKLYAGNLLSTEIKNICPKGWHIPTLQEWNDLIDAFGGLKNAGTSLKESSDLYWRYSKNVRTNNSGISILPSGSRDSKPSFSNIGKYSFYWTSTPSPKIQNSFYSIDLGFMRDNIIISNGDPNWSYSIRCIKDK